MTILFSVSFQLIVVIIQRKSLAYADTDLTCQNLDFKDFHSCAANNDEPFPLCYCDALCHLFEDCCRDAPNDHNLTKKDLEHLSEIYRVNDSSCTTISGAQNQYGVWIVEYCNKSACTTDPNSLFSNIPVTDLQGLTYRNKECAECNGVQKFRSWYPTFFDLLEDHKFLDDVMQSGMSATETAVNLFRKMRLGTVILLLQFEVMVMNSNGPRFCFAFSEAQNECPTYVSPYGKHCQGSLILSRNRLCADKDGVCEWEGCLPFFNPFESTNQLRELSYPVTIVIRFTEDENSESQTDDAAKSLSLVELQYVKVNLLIAFQTEVLDRQELQNYVESLILSFFYHSGYKLKLIHEIIYIFSERVSCQLGGHMDYYILADLSSHSILNKSELQDLLNLIFYLTYSDANIKLKAMVNSSDVSRFHVLANTPMDFTRVFVKTELYDVKVYEFSSEMIKCRELSVTSTDDNEANSVVSTKCLKKKSNVVTDHNNRIKGIRQENGGNSIRGEPVSAILVLSISTFLSFKIVE